MLTCAPLYDEQRPGAGDSILQNEHEYLIVSLKLYLTLSILWMAPPMSGLGLSEGMQGAVLGIALTTIIFFIVVGVGRILSPQRQRRFWAPYPPLRWDQHRFPDLRDAAQQLHAVKAASFKKQRLLNREEYRVFKVVETEVNAARKGYRVLAQTNLGEIIHSSDDNAHHSINSKRVDILVIDCGGWPMLAVEYHGGGHYRGNAAARDAVKKEALRKAGVGYLEFVQSDRNDQIRSRVREQLGWETATCGFRLKPAGYSEAKPARVPI